jgi:4-hydroxybenzoate polyprenyltransferase
LQGTRGKKRLLISTVVSSETVPNAVRQRTLRAYFNFIKIEHTLFALPFAYGGMFLASSGWPGWPKFFWVTVAMLGARTASMALNRVIDADIDQKNPRTSGRAIPVGHLTKADGVVLGVIGFALLSVASWALNTLTLALLPVAVLFLGLYPLTKRWTWWCHLWLGVTIGAAAPGGWIAITGSFSSVAVALWIGVGLWVAGFDIIYSLLDKDFDIREGIYSVPARFGSQRALAIAAWAHVFSLGGFFSVIPLARLGIPYGLSVITVAIILTYEHTILRRGGVNAVSASFGANLLVGVIVVIGILVDLWVG